MEKYCHFIAIYTLLSTLIFFRVGNLLFLSLPKCLFFVSPQSSLSPPRPLAGQLTGDVGAEGGGGGGERICCLVFVLGRVQLG